MPSSHLRSILILAAACLLQPAALMAQAGAAGAAGVPAQKSAVATRIDRDVIRVDGRLNEASWAQAAAITDFVQKDPVEGGLPTERMEVRFLYSESALYVGARMYKNSGAPIQASVGRRDNVSQSEYVLVALDTFHDHRTAYVFGVSGAGVRLDRFHPGDDEAIFDAGYDPVWEAGTSIDADGWTAEFWIPFSQLRFNPGDEQTWGLNIRRYTPTLEEDDYWVPIPRTVVAWSSRFGVLTGIRGLRSTRRIELMPYVASSSTVLGEAGRGNPFNTGANLHGWGGADVRMGVGPNLTLDATFNPDFGQVEADPAEVNLSALETVFAEKRPFFVEGAQFLAVSNAAPAVMANNYFYSRRIGARPFGPATGTFVDFPQRISIPAAAKLTGRLPSGVSLGLMTVVTDEEAARTSGPDLRTTTVRVAPRSSFSLGRVRKEFGRGSSAGGIATFVHRQMADTDPLAAVAAQNALTLGSDARFRLRNGEYEIVPMMAATFIQGTPDAIARVQRSSVHYFQRPDREPGSYDPTRTSLNGFKGAVGVQRSAGRHWLWNGSTELESSGYDPNSMGFLNTAEGRSLNGDIRYRETVPGRFLRNYAVGTRLRNEWNAQAYRQQGLVDLYTNQSWRNFWTSAASVTRTMERLDSRLTRGGPIMTAPAGWSGNLNLKNSPAAETSWSADLNLARTEAGGSTFDFSAHLAVRPSPRWQVAIDPSIVRLVDTQQYVATLDGGPAATYGKRYVFGRIDRSTYSVQGRVTYAFKPDLTLDVYVEPFAASGRYADVGELTAPATRDRRIYGIAPGTTATPTREHALRVTDGAASYLVPATDFKTQSLRSNVVLRWEYRPSSTLFVVWQQDRQGTEPVGSRAGWGDAFGAFSAPGSHYFIVKTSVWLSAR